MNWIPREITKAIGLFLVAEVYERLVEARVDIFHFPSSNRQRECERPIVTSRKWTTFPRRAFGSFSHFSLQTRMPFKSLSMLIAVKYQNWGWRQKKVRKAKGRESKDKSALNFTHKASFARAPQNWVCERERERGEETLKKVTSQIIREQTTGMEN